MNHRRRLFLSLAGLALTAPRALAAAPARIHRGVPTVEQSLPFIAAEAGIFSRLGLQVAFVEGEADFAFAALPQIAERRLQGDDAVAIATVLEPNRGGFLMASAAIRGPEQLAGARVGVISENGPSAQAAQAVLERAGAKASLVALQNYPAIFAALSSGAIDAGWLPVDLAIRGRVAQGWTTFQGVRLSLPGAYVTDRRTIAADRAHVAALVRGIVAAIHLFKTNEEAVIPLLQRYASVDRETATELHAFHAPLLRPQPVPSVFFGLPSLRSALAGRYPAAARLEAADLVDATFVDDLVREGYIARLYSPR